MAPDISVIIPTYQRPQLLVHALDSALGQRGAAIEIIVVDDCPDHSAAQVIAAYSGQNVRYIANTKPSGGHPAIVRNLGWSQATGRYLHFLDDDDIVPEGHYERVLAAFSRAPKVGTVFGRIKPFGDDLGALAPEETYFILAERRASQLRWLGDWIGFSSWLLCKSTFLVCSSAVVSRDCVSRIGGFNTEMEINEDVDFLGRAIRCAGAIKLHETAIYYRIHSSLMHGGPDKHIKFVRSYRLMQDRYALEHGKLELLALKILASLVEKLPC
jgi:glycosyltransferase involved in cell wall biosynthesis